MFEIRVPAGQKLPAPAHRNDAYEEILYGVEGVLTWTVDGTPFAVGPGQVLCIPRGAVHRFDNLGRKDVKSSSSSARRSWGRRTSAMLPKSSTPPAVRPTTGRCRRSSGATA